MQKVMARLRAALSTPVALLLIAGALLLLFYSASQGAQQTGTALEQRVAKALSAMEGAGQVEVVIRTKTLTSSGQTSLLSGSAQTTEVPCGAVAVAQGADDPLVRMQLTQALCALLGLPASAVQVVNASGGSGR